MTPVDVMMGRMSGNGAKNGEGYMTACPKNMGKEKQEQLWGYSTTGIDCTNTHTIPVIYITHESDTHDTGE